MPRFSVLMPTHNRTDVIGFAIASVLRQTIQDFELLIVGDGCTDNTAEIVKQFNDPRITWFDLPKGHGFGYANRNVALRQAKGELIAFCAHDDILFSDHLELLARELEKSKAEWVYSKPVWVTSDGIILPTANGDLRQESVQKNFFQANFIPASNVVHTRECFEKYGYWSEELKGGGDWELWKRIIEGGQRKNIGYCSTPTMLHFNAIWKGGRISNLLGLQTLLTLADQAQWYPSVLKLPVSAFTTEQAAADTQIQNSVHEFETTVRQGLEIVLEYLMNNLVQKVLPFIDDFLSEVSSVNGQKKDLGSVLLDEKIHSITHMYGQLAHQIKILNQIKHVLNYRENNQQLNDLELLSHTYLFNAEWYSKKYPDIGRAGADPTVHYLKWGWKEFRQPSPYFDTRQYVQDNPIVLELNINPLIHFLRHKQDAKS
jgi:glycosyltransferase involved in cell wall biosynthesis